MIVYNGFFGIMRIKPTWAHSIPTQQRVIRHASLPSKQCVTSQVLYSFFDKFDVLFLRAGHTGI